MKVLAPCWALWQAQIHPKGIGEVPLDGAVQRCKIHHGLTFTPHMEDAAYNKSHANKRMESRTVSGHGATKFWGAGSMERGLSRFPLTDLDPRPALIWMM